MRENKPDPSPADRSHGDPSPDENGAAQDRSLPRRLFSVMETRDDLPRMPGFMAAVFILLAAGAAAASARICSPAVPDDPMAAENIAGILASLPFLPLAVTLYSITILLWRRVASLLCTPLSFGLMLLLGTRFSDAAVLSLAILPMAYAFAVSLISREDRFRRVMTLAIFAACALGIAAAVRIGLDFGSPENLRDAFMTAVPDMIGAALLGPAGGMQAASGEGAAAMLTSLSLYDTARSLFIMLPAYFGMFCVVLAWACDRIIRLLFAWLNCADVFTDEGAEVSMPVRFAAVYAAFLILSILTPGSVFPMARCMLQSVVLVMGLPCAAVGVRRIGERLSDSLFYMTREKLFTAMLLFVLFAAVGAYPFLLITSAVGMISVLRRGRARDRGNNE